MAKKVVAGRRSREPKTYTVTLRFSDLIWIGVGAALALSIFFLFGLLIGRGYVAATPEDPAPVTVMHGTVGSQDDTTGQSASGEATQPADAAAQQAGNATETKPEEEVVLRPEDLNYPDNLAQTESKDTEEAAETKQPTAKPESAEAAPETTPQAAVEEPNPDEPTFDYVYQVAASKDAAAAERLRTQLADRGMEALVSQATVNGTVWHRVKVRFRGTPTQTVPLRDSIEDVTGQRPIRTSKKKVTD